MAFPCVKHIVNTMVETRRRRLPEPLVLIDLEGCYTTARPIDPPRSTTAASLSRRDVRAVRLSGFVRTL